MVKFDMKMQNANRHICLLVNGFLAHYIDYEPCNIQIIYFEPNLTSFVQPLDAGIIWCFEAHYQQQFCEIVIERDELGEENLYEIDLLKAMLMANKAWKQISQSAIANCWSHMEIQG